MGRAPRSVPAHYLFLEWHLRSRRSPNERPHNNRIMRTREKITPARRSRRARRQLVDGCFFLFFFRTTCDAVWTVFFLGFASLPRLINGSVDVAVCGIETSVLVVWNGVKVGEKLIGRINDIGF